MKTAELKSEVESKQIKINYIQNINKSAEKTSEDSIKIMNHFVKADGAIDFVSSVESVASGFLLKYNTNTIENIEEETLAAQDKQILRVSMSLSGGWKNILKFLTYIESLPYAVRVEKAEITAEITAESMVSSGDTSSANGSTGTKIQASESTWRLSLVFSVVKIKEKDNR
jgi:Tfp pilus assembly protein PilO